MLATTIDSWLESIGERINPILVKETRQALKSRQFSVTFLLLLAASLIVSFGGVALSGPALSYRSAGAVFFIAYFVILAFAVFVIVPFGAYRSLAAEQEERTFELISITKLKPREIIAGKLLSAAIQMLIYFSAIGPCMTFTLLLKGIDVPSILMVLCLAAFGSIGLSMGGLMLASLARRRGWHIFLSVALLSVLLFAMVVSNFLAASVVSFVAPQMRTTEFWMGMATGITIYLSYFVLIFQLSSAQLTFEADNRSTRIRLSLVAQSLLVVGWVAYWWATQGHGNFSYIIVIGILACLHWFLVGSFLVSEHHGISQRIAREIPRHRRAQAFLSLLLPGPARGLTFLLANLFCLVAVTGVGEMAAIWSGATVAAAGKQYVTLVVMALASYVAFYCGLGRLFVAALRRRRSIPTPTGAALVWLLAAIGSAVPNFFAMISPLHQFQVYYLWQLTDPIATVREIYDSPPWTSLAFIPIGMSLLAILFNLRGMANGVMEVIAAGLQAPFRRRKSATDPALATDRPSDGVAGSAELSMRSASEG